MVVAGAGVRAGAGVAAGAGGGTGAAVTPPVRHCSTYCFSVMPFASLSALFARHSDRHSFAVFPFSAEAGEGGEGACAGAEAGGVAAAAPRHCAT